MFEKGGLNKWQGKAEGELQQFGPWNKWGAIKKMHRNETEWTIGMKHKCINSLSRIQKADTHSFWLKSYMSIVGI